jgi:hypothetical protein
MLFSLNSSGTLLGASLPAGISPHEALLHGGTYMKADLKLTVCSILSDIYNA